MRNIRSGILPLLFTAAFLGACSQENGTADRPNSGEVGSARLHLNIAKSQVPLSDSLVIDLVGPDTFHVVLPGDSAKFDKTLDPGDWNFYAKFYANGILVQRGEASAKLAADDDKTVSIEMKAVAGFLSVQIPLGLGNPLDIARGTLLVDGDKDYDFQIGEQTATAATGLLELGKTYTVHVYLYSKSGEILFQTSSEVTIDGENFAVDWKLSSLRADVSFEIVVDSLRTLSATGHLPSKLRTPKSGDLLITEFLTGSKCGFVEIYNPSLDTLDLSDCNLWGSSGSTFKQATESLVDVKMTPNSYLVFGADTCDVRDVTASISLTTTKGSIVFRCEEDVAIDSLFYANSKIADSLGIAAFPLSSSKTVSVQLPIQNYKTKDQGDSWCSGEYSLHADASCNE